MRSCKAAAGVLAALVGLAALAPSASATSGSDPRVTVTGKLIRVETHGSTLAADGDPALILTADRTLVPVDSEAFSDVEPGSRVRVELTVPAKVAATARNGSRVAGVSLDRADLAAASGSTPATQRSDIGRATILSAVDGDHPLQVSAVALISEAVSTYAPAVHDLYVAQVTPAGMQQSAWGDERIADQVSAASDYWAGESGGAISLELTTITPSYISAYACSQYSQVWTEAAVAVGFPGGPNDHLVVSLSPAADKDVDCSYGLGTVGSSVNSGGMLYVADDGWPVLAHELGHNMSLRHANRMRCTAAADSLYYQGGWSTPGCAEVSYGDPYDVMGISPYSYAGALSSPQAIRTGLLDPSAYATVSSATSDVTLSPLASRVGTRAVVVADPRGGGSYYVEYRTHAGQDKTVVGSAAAGVRVLRFNSGTGTTVVLDATPTSTASDYDAVVKPGTTFTSYSGGVVVSVASATTNSATMRVSSLPESQNPPTPTPTPTPTLTPPPSPSPAPKPTPATPTTTPTVTPEPHPTATPLPTMVIPDTIGLRLSTTRVGYGARPTLFVLSVLPLNGPVRVTDAGRLVATGALSFGNTSLRLPVMAVGSHTLTATHTGTSTATARVTLTVRKAASKVRVVGEAPKPTPRRASPMTVRVTSTTTPTGTVTVKEGRRVVTRGSVRSGTVKVRLPRMTRGTHKLWAYYSGSKTVTACKVRVLLKVKS